MPEPKRLTVLGIVLVAFAVPATASATIWTEVGEPLAHADVSVSGVAEFAAGDIAATKMNVTAKVTLEEGSTGTVKSFVADECQGTRGSIAGLKCTSTALSLPWTVHANANGTITVTDVTMDSHYYHPILDPEHKNPLGTSLMTGDVLATPTSNPWTNVILSGINTHVANNAATVIGSLTVEPGGVFGTE